MRTVIVLMFSATAYVFLKDQLDPRNLLGLLSIVAVMTFILGAASFAPLKDSATDQAKRDRRLQQAVQERGWTFQQTVEARANASLAGEDNLSTDEEITSWMNSLSTTILYLRPFAVDLMFRVQNPKRRGFAAFTVPFYRLILPEHVSLDEAMRPSIKEYGDLVAIGAPGEPIGAARLRVSDSQWKEYFRALAEHSIAIIIFPGLRPGTLWEINSIRVDRSLLEKTIFVFPPTEKNQQSAMDINSFDKMKKALTARGLPVPKDLKPGDALIFRGDRSVEMRATIFSSWFEDASLSKWELKRLLDKILELRSLRLVEEARSLQPDLTSDAIADASYRADGFPRDDSVAAFLSRIGPKPNSKTS